MEHTGVKGSGHQVIGSGDGVDIAGKVQVEILHRDHLAVTAAGRAALDAKGRPLAGLPDAGEYALPQMRTQRLAEPNHGSGFALAQRCGSNGRHIDVFAIWNVL